MVAALLATPTDPSDPDPSKNWIVPVAAATPPGGVAPRVAVSFTACP
jgi:hypothetical protein